MMRSGTMEVGGVELHRVEWLPQGQAQAVAVLVHGQGDCAERHAVTVAPLVERGIACCAFDWPGHGRSPGPRGTVPGFAFLSEALGQIAGDAQERFGAPVRGWLAHSAGGLVLVHHLAASGTTPEFLWLNAPLVDPGVGRSRLVVALGRVAARIVPNWRISIGVFPSDCWVDEKPGESTDERDDGAAGNEGRKPASKEPADAHAIGVSAEEIAEIRKNFGHHWINLGWADEMFRMAKSLPKTVRRLPEKTKLLFTQGLADPVCPPEIGKKFFESLPMRNKRWVGLDDARHECFADQFAPRLRHEVAIWLEKVVLDRIPESP